MAGFRAEEPRSWEPPPDLDLSDDETVSFWTRRLQVTRFELEEVVERVSLSASAEVRQPQ